MARRKYFTKTTEWLVVQLGELETQQASGMRRVSWSSVGSSVSKTVEQSIEDVIDGIYGELSLRDPTTYPPANGSRVTRTRIEVWGSW